MSATTLPGAKVVRFYPRRGLSYKHEKDHLVVADADRTLCGREAENFPKSSGTTVGGVVFDPSVPWACKRCVAALAKWGPVRMFSRISFWDDGRWSTVSAPAGGPAPRTPASGRTPSPSTTSDSPVSSAVTGEGTGRDV